MKKISLLVLIIITTVNVEAQDLRIPKTDENNFEFSLTKGGGYALMGLGAATIGYTASRTYPEKNATTLYVVGGALIVAGLYILLTGDKDPEPKYWKGIQGFSPNKNSETFLYSQGFRPDIFCNPPINVVR